MENSMKQGYISDCYLFYKTDRIYAIVGYIGEVDKYIDNKGYVDRDSGRIFICSTNKKSHHSDVPILKVEDKIEKIDSCSSCIDERFNLKNCVSLSFNNIIDKSASIADDDIYDEKALADMNAATSIFVPVIDPEDDGLKKIVKQLIISKNIDINRLKSKMPQKYGITNLKSALVGKTKMSISSFNIWCELLGANYTIHVTDNGKDMISPLEVDLEYNNIKDVVIELDKN